MGFFILLMGAAGAASVYSDVGDTVSQKEWVAFGFCALLVIIGGVIHLMRGDE